MFEEVVPLNSIKILNRIAPFINSFYLAGGTGLALQFGHRRSFDFDFFTEYSFEVETLLTQLKPDKITYSSKNTIHCIIEGANFSFLHYEYPLTEQKILWNNIYVAHYCDIVAEKIKTISQRGAKRDFYDLYFALTRKITPEEAFQVFIKRFGKAGISKYHILRSLTYFEDAEAEPEPILLREKFTWEEVKDYFLRNIKKFESLLLRHIFW